MYAVGLDVTPKKLHAMLIRLTVELLFVQSDVLLCQTPAQLREKRQDVGLLTLWHAENDVIDKTHDAQPAFLVEPFYLVVYIQSHGRLPYQPADGCTLALRLAEQALVRTDMLLPEIRRRAPLAVGGRVGVNERHAEPFQVRAFLFAVCGTVDNRTQLSVCNVPQCAGEVALQVNLYHPCRLSIAVAYLTDILDELIDGSLRTLSLAVVVCTRT